MEIRFTKMQGTGNDYVYIDCFESPVPEDLPALARWVADRHFGIGSDGLILIHRSEIADARMQMFNADGSEAEMCGNGLRCVAKYVHDHQYVEGNQQKIETGHGILETQLTIQEGLATSVRIDMGVPVLVPSEIPTRLGEHQVVDHPLMVENTPLDVTCVSMGNPHCVVFVDRISDDHVLRLGPAIETHPDFQARTNVEFVQVCREEDEVLQRTWERGSGETLACGTGACAVCVAGVLTGRTPRRIVCHLRGGDLLLHWDESDGHVYLSGPAEEVFSGTFEWK